jgi:N-acetylglucosaminyl-diphospho-decaprenol L-rhamnosyltransferase
MPTSLDIIIVNRNSGIMLKKCLSSISKSLNENFILSKVIVVDDCSSDNSLIEIETIDIPIKLIHNDRRSGYGFSCNIGAQYCDSDYLLFLNTDVALNSNSIEDSLKYLDKNEQIGILGIKQYDQNGKLQMGCSRFPNTKMFFTKSLGLNKIFPKIFLGPDMLEFDHNSSRQVDHIIGAIMFIRRGVFKTIGGYDERFFVYYEDLDLSIRVKKLGYKIFYYTEANATHIGNSTAKKTWTESRFFNLRSRILYAFKHFNIISAILVLLNSLFIDPLIKVLWSIIRFSIDGIIVNISVIIILIVNLPIVLIKGPRSNWPFK